MTIQKDDLDIIYSRIRIHIIIFCVASVLSLVMSLVLFAILIAEVGLADLGSHKSIASIRMATTLSLLLNLFCNISFAGVCAKSMFAWFKLIDRALRDATRAYNSAVGTNPVHPTMARQEMWNASFIILIIYHGSLITNTLIFAYFVDNHF